MPPKKSANKKSKKEESDDMIEPVEDVEIEEESNDIEETEEADEPPLDDDDEEEEEDEFKDDEEINGNKECAIEIAIEDDNEYFDNEEDIEVQPDTTVEYVKPSERISASKLTKYEMVRILGERTKQLTMGAKPLIKNYQTLPYDRIAEEELKLNMIPFKIRRPLPNGKFELWFLEELNKQHLISLLD
jgi:DNA-directed RNA polymerase subunit K/omega